MLTDVSALAQFHRDKDWSLHIEDNLALETLDGLAVVTELAAFAVVANPSLRSLDGMHGLALVAGDVVVDRNPALVEIGLGSLHHVGGDVTFTDNAALSTRAIDHLVGGLETLGGTLTIRGNAR
jgi:hypothetical protein